jgi:hypothetical protein
MSQSRPNHSLVVALWVNAALLLALLVAVISRSEAQFPSVLPAAYAQNQLPIGGGAGVFIVPAQFSVNTYGCYLMDIDAQTIVAYQFMPADRQLRLVAARHFRYDRRLHNYNTHRPTPNEVRALLEQEQANERAVEIQIPEPQSPEIRLNED